MREGWVETTLGEVARTRPPAGVAAPGIPYVALEHFDSGNPALHRWGDTADATSATTPFEAGDVLFGKLRPYLRKVVVADFSGRCTNEALAYRVSSPTLSQEYLALLLRSDAALSHASVTTGTRMPRTSARSMASMRVLLPSIEEQRRIVDLMSHADGDIETQVSEISATIRCWTGALRAAQPTKGAEHPLTRIFSFVIGGAWGSPPGEDETNVLALGTSAFAGDALTVDPGRGTERSLSVDRAQKRGIMRGDILLERSGGSPTQPVGRVIRALEDSQHVVPSDFQRLLRPDTELIDAGFAFWTLWMNYQDGVVLPYQKNTTSIRNLQVTEYLNNARIVIPDMSAQRDWVALAQQFEHLVDTQRVQLGRSRALRSSLLTALLSGEHAVPDSYDEFIRNEGAA